MNAALVSLAACLALAAGLAAPAAQTATTLEAQLRAARVPELDLHNAPVDEALGLAMQLAGVGDRTPRMVEPRTRNAGTTAIPRVTLRLRNISLYDALRYICEVAGLQFRIDKKAVIITPVGASQGPVITRLYPVQPTTVDALKEAGYPVTRTGGGADASTRRGFAPPKARP